MMQDEGPDFTLADAHEHTFQVVASGETVIRWCPLCGRAWKLVADGSHWQDISEYEEYEENARNAWRALGTLLKGATCAEEAGP